MSEPKPIHRLEETADGVRVVTKDRHDLYGNHPEGRPNVLTREYEDLFAEVAEWHDDGTGRVRIGTAAHVGDCSGWQIHGANGIYAEVPFETRELTAAERAWCDETSIHSDTESVVEFSIPHPEDLRSAIVDQDLARFECLEAIIPDHDRRHDVLTEIQERIERERVLANQLHPREGILTDVPPEWDPTNDHNDGKTREHLHDMAGMRKDAHLQDFEPVAGFVYWSFWYARSRVLEFHEPELEPWDVCGLGVVGRDGWTYCRECGAVAPGETFLHVDLERRDVTRRVCGRCADRKADSEVYPQYTPENVAAARDGRAQREGGQRNLAGDY